MTADFTTLVKRALRRIPKGRVATYGQISELAGSPRAARQVVRILHSSSERDNLPWHRVINREGKIALKRGQGFELQQALLEAEGIFVEASGRIDLTRFQWRLRPR
ncbi:MAG: MGMT family protein [bacterium]